MSVWRRLYHIPDISREVVFGGTGDTAMETSRRIQDGLLNSIKRAISVPSEAAYRLVVGTVPRLRVRRPVPRRPKPGMPYGQRLALAPAWQRLHA